MKPTKILTINLFDIKVPNKVKFFSNFLNGAKDLAREHKDLFAKKNIPIEIFHNDNIAYSGIQFSRHLGAAQFTAIGNKEVKALKLWYKLFKQNKELPLTNTQIIKETYQFRISTKNFKYAIATILLRKEVHKELQKLEILQEKISRLQGYLLGNIKTTFLDQHLNIDVTDVFVKINIIDFKKKNTVLSTYHGGKLVAYQIKFTSNVYLPHTLRLGQAVALGYGTVKHIT